MFEKYAKKTFTKVKDSAISPDLVRKALDSKLTKLFSAKKIPMPKDNDIKEATLDLNKFAKEKGGEKQQAKEFEMANQVFDECRHMGIMSVATLLGGGCATGQSMKEKAYEDCRECGESSAFYCIYCAEDHYDKAMKFVDHHRETCECLINGFEDAQMFFKNTCTAASDCVGHELACWHPEGLTNLCADNAIHDDYILYQYHRHVLSFMSAESKKSLKKVLGALYFNSSSSSKESISSKDVDGSDDSENGSKWFFQLTEVASDYFIYQLSLQGTEVEHSTPTNGKFSKNYFVTHIIVVAVIKFLQLAACLMDIIVVAVIKFYQLAACLMECDNKSKKKIIGKHSTSRQHHVLKEKILKVEDSHVHNLRMPMMELSGSISPAISELVCLKVLDLSGNPKLSGPIPSDLTKLEQLESFSIAGNGMALSSKEIETIAGLISSLKELDLSRNALNCSLNKILGLSERTSKSRVSKLKQNQLKNLEKLFLNECGLVGHLPDVLRTMSLKELDVSCNQLDGKIVVPSPLTIEKFYCRGNFLVSVLEAKKQPGKKGESNDSKIDSKDGSNGDDQKKSFLKDLGKCKRLKILDVSHNELTGSLPILGKRKGLKSIHFNNNRFDGDIPKEYGYLKKLELFDVSYNKDLSGNMPVSMPEGCEKRVNYSGVSLVTVRTKELEKGNCYLDYWCVAYLLFIHSLLTAHPT